VTVNLRRAWGRLRLQEYARVIGAIEASRSSVGFRKTPMAHKNVPWLPARPLIWRQDLQPPFRSRQKIIINAPLEAVWSFSMDLTKIPEFHPRVVQVDLLSGKSFREPGVSYQCHLSGGKHTCVEKDIEIIPLQKIVTVLPEDTFGISKILSDYRVETTFQTLGDRSTKVEIAHYYSTTTLKAKLINLIAKGKIARETQATLNAAKAMIEATC
jgi:Polyketide cyclase / dehydrase and lipid transport